MNNIILMGRLTRDPDVRTTTGDNPTTIARYTLAVDRNYKAKDKQQQADFIPCVAMNKNAEFAEKYLHKGTKIIVEGQLRSGSYTNQDGNKIYTLDCMIDRHEFCESKAEGTDRATADDAFVTSNTDEGFINVPDGIDDELPFG